MNAQAMMILGMGMHVGNSSMVAALCRIFPQQHVYDATFESQNTILNFAAKPEVLEAARAQAEIFGPADTARGVNR